MTGRPAATGMAAADPAGLADRLARLGDTTRDLARAAFEDTVRIGVTGLSRAGKTVFLTSLVHNLIHGGRLAALSAAAEGRLIAAMLRPQPDPAMPRFDYEAHLAALAGDPPAWPDSTRRSSQLRLSLSYRPGNFLVRQFRGQAVLNLDLVDYPGEWLFDLALLGQSYADWSAEVLADCRRPPRARLAADWVALVDATNAGAAADDATMRQAAAAYTAYLTAARDAGTGLSRLGPGRFVSPGELAGSPMLAFAPLALPTGGRARRGSLWAAMQDRYDLYRDRVVRPFFRDHFARIDRQIVLVDVLTALNHGQAAVADLGAGLNRLLKAFRPGRNSLLSALTGRRVETVVFAATKADHLPADQHDRLADLLRRLLFERINQAAFQGAAVSTLALAALRATRQTRARLDGAMVECLTGHTLADGREVVAWPGEIPARPQDIPADGGTLVDIRAFRPPPGAPGDARGMAHLRLDHALDRLIGDRLA